MTRSQKNEVEAARAAEKISLILKEHNKKFKDKEVEKLKGLEVEKFIAVEQ